MAVLAAVSATGFGQPAPAALPDDAVLTLDHAQRICTDSASRVDLPDWQPLKAGQVGPVDCHYRLNVPNFPRGLGLFIPGLGAHARVSVNGHVVSASFRDVMEPVPRSVDRIILIDIPDPYWTFGNNVVDIQAKGPRSVALSRVYLGPVAEVKRLHRLRVLGVVLGPALVAAAVGTLGLCLLLLWLRRRDALFGYFGAGTLGWAVHTLWTIMPWSPLRFAHFTIWWTALYTFFVVMLIIFCVRFAEWHWPRAERLLWGVALSTPAVLYLANFAGALTLADELWRLLLIGMVCFGVVAVTRALFKRPDTDKLLVMASGAVSLAFGIHDWLRSETDGGDNPVYLVPYAGLIFVVFVVRMLIDRFAGATEQLEVMNVELERRVASQNAELHDAVEKMRLARDDAEAADQAKTRFLAAASHDLRQPAHALALYMAALRAERLDPTQADLVQRMSGSLSALEAMFNMLLDMSRIDAGGLAPAPRAFALGPMLRHLADEFAPQAEAQGLRLALRLPSTAAFTHSDPVLVERIVRNLLANAIKYTERGGILLACRLRRTGQPGAARAAARSQWRIEVWDTGVGIAERDRERVFEEFFQVGNPGRDRAKGLGLGLSIVHRLVRLLELELLLYSRLQHGSCFALYLPQADAIASPRDGRSPAIVATDIAGMIVGLIEDDTEVRDAMRALLQRWGCTVVEGADAAELARGLREARCGLAPDALLVDQRLSAGKTGPAEAAILFGQWQRTAPMLIVTGESDLGDIKAAGHACLAKPVSISLLRHWLASVRRASAGQAIASSTSGDTP